MKKTMKIISGIIAFVIIGALLFFANAFLGNPVSKMIVKNAAKNYIEENYKNRDFVIDEVQYNFKDSGYNAYVKSPSSVDTHFTVYISMTGKIYRDSYESVINGWNTYQRIEKEYRDMVDEILSSDEFPLVSHIDFGTIKIIENVRDMEVEFGGSNYGLKLTELELDKEYDVKELAKTVGNIVYYAEDEEVSFEKAAVSLLKLKEFFDEKNVSFYAIDFILEKPKGEEGYIEDDFRVYVANFLYSDIYEDGLEARIEVAHNALMEYNREQDAKVKD